jgi:hypothetical protein
MEEKEDKFPEVAPSNPANDFRKRDRVLPSTQPTQLSLSRASGSNDPSKSQAEGLRIDPEEEKKREVDLNALFPGKGYDLNRLFPEEGTKKLLFELRRNKREIERFIKNLDLEEK